MTFGLGSFFSGAPARKYRGRVNSDEELGYNFNPANDARKRDWDPQGAKGRSCGASDGADSDMKRKFKPLLLRRLFLSALHVRSLLVLTSVALAISTFYLKARTSAQAAQLEQLRFRLEGKTLEFERQATRHFARVQELTDKAAEAEAARESMSQMLGAAPQQQQLQQKLQEAQKQLEAVQNEKKDLAAKLEARSQELKALEDKSQAVLDELSRLTSGIRQLKGVTATH